MIVKSGFHMTILMIIGWASWMGQHNTDEISLSVELHGLTNLSKATTEMTVVTTKSWVDESCSVLE